MTQQRSRLGATILLLALVAIVVAFLVLFRDRIPTVGPLLNQLPLIRDAPTYETILGFMSANPNLSIGSIGGLVSVSGIVIGALKKAKGAYTTAQTKITEVTGQLGELRAVKDTAEAQFATLTTAKDSALKQLQDYQSQFNALKTEANSLKTTNTALLTQMKELLTQMKDKQEDLNDALTEINVLKSRLNDLKVPNYQ